MAVWNPTRRRFLQTTAAAGAAVAFPWVARSQDRRKLRVALIGVAGRGRIGVDMGRGEHVTALCDADTTQFSNPKKLPYLSHTPPAAADLFPDAARFQDYRELFESPDLFDAVVVCTPDHHHFPAALRAIRLGKAVYCEKPLAWSAWEAHRLAVEAEKHKVPTQLGNQGMAGHGWRVAQAYVEGGAIGEIREVHTFTGSHENLIPCGLPRPEGEDPVPEGLDWDLWLGPAPERPYAKRHYHPFRWRSRVDFGNGILGDWCCHLMNAFFKIFEPGYPAAVECLDQAGFNGESWHTGKILKWTFAAANGRPGFDAYWYEGTFRPPRPAHLEAERELGEHGSFLVGDKATVWIQGSHNHAAVLVPETARQAFGNVAMKTPKSIGHMEEFVRAAKGQSAYNAPLSHFGYGGTLTASALLGNIAARVEGRLRFDGDAFRFIDNERANELLRRPSSRPGWDLRA